MNRRAPRLLLAGLLLAAPAMAEPLPELAQVAQPRAFGHQLGDVISQRVLLELDGQPFAPQQLPSPERVNTWFERRAATLEQDAQGRTWLRADYQLINVPPQLRVVTLPGWRLDPARGDTGLQVPDWPLSVAPLSRESAFSESGLGMLRPDRSPRVPERAPLQRALAASLAALLATIAAWAGWWLWRERVERARLPFARTARVLRHLPADDPAAWRSLHRAFDLAAGRVLDASNWRRLLLQRPEFAPLAGDIERFYQASAQRFFADRAPPEAISPHALGEALRRIERASQR